MSAPHIEFYNAAIDAVQAGQMDEALKAAENSLTEEPNDAQSWQLYAVILNALGQTDRAAKAMEKVKDLGLSEIDELLMKAADAAGAGKIGVAITCYEDALEIEGDRADIHVSYAMVLLEGKYFDDAKDASAKAVELAPNDAPAWYTRGRVLRLTGQQAEALEALTKATELDDNLILAFYERGMLLAAKGDLKPALACFEKVLEAHPQDSGAAEAKANILAKIDEGEV